MNFFVYSLFFITGDKLLLKYGAKFESWFISSHVSETTKFLLQHSECLSAEMLSSYTKEHNF